MASTFHFRLEPVRQLSERRETQAQSALAAALADEAAARTSLADAAARAEDAVRGLARCLGADGSGAVVSGAQLRAQEAWIGRTVVLQHELALDVDRRVTECDARRGLLAEAARDHEVLVRLREKRVAEHRAEQDRLEQDALDEIALGLHRRRSA